MQQGQSQLHINKLTVINTKHIQAFRGKLLGYSHDILKEKYFESNLLSACVNYILYYYFVYKYSCYSIYIVMFGGF